VLDLENRMAAMVRHMHTLADMINQLEAQLREERRRARYLRLRWQDLDDRAKALAASVQLEGTDEVSTVPDRHEEEEDPAEVRKSLAEEARKLGL